MNRIRSFFDAALCLIGGHRPVRLESELVRRDAPPRWSFRCGDCGERYWWPR